MKRELSQELSDISIKKPKTNSFYSSTNVPSLFSIISSLILIELPPITDELEWINISSSSLWNLIITMPSRFNIKYNNTNEDEMITSSLRLEELLYKATVEIPNAKRTNELIECMDKQTTVKCPDMKRQCFIKKALRRNNSIAFRYALLGTLYPKSIGTFYIPVDYVNNIPEVHVILQEFLPKPVDFKDKLWDNIMNILTTNGSFDKHCTIDIDYTKYWNQLITNLLKFETLLKMSKSDLNAIAHEEQLKYIYSKQRKDPQQRLVIKQTLRMTGDKTAVVAGILNARSINNRKVRVLNNN